LTQPDEFLQISTPENVAFEYPIAGIGSRFIAALVDTCLIAVLQMMVLLFGALLAGNLWGLQGVDLGEASGWIFAATGLLGFAFLWGYYIFFELIWNGQSPGKRLVGLRVIRRDGGPITASESAIRNLIRVIDFLPMLYGVGVVAMFIDPNSRRLGDLAAGTLVVRELRTSDRPESYRPPAPVWPAKSQESPFFSVDDLRKLAPEDLAAVESLLKRRYELTDPERLAGQILEGLCRRMEVPLPPLDPNRRLRALEELLLTARGGYNSRQ
jgi:uncharacterized RDD family membrane protein YckC